MNKTVLFLLVLGIAFTSYAQVDPVKEDLTRFNRPTTSQRSEVSQKIGVDFIHINYGRPNVKGRKIFGGLLKYDKIWRLGADYQSVIDFQNEYIIQNDTIKKGKYTLYAVPNEKEWTIYLNSDTEGWGQYTYDATKNVYEFQVPAEKSPEFTETLTIGFMNTTMNRGELYFQWENIRAKLPITVSTKHRKDIDKNIAVALGLNERNVGYKYYLASEYYFIEDKDYERALTYIQKAIESGNKAFYTHYLKGEILYAMGDKEKAIAAAKEAKLNLFKGFSNPEWEHKIDKAITDWKH